MITFEIDDISEMNAELFRFIKYLEGRGVNADAVFDSRLVSCELITNVIRHCGCSALFSGMLTDGEITITVRASSPTGEISVPELPEVLAESGRGLYIVNALSGGNVKITGGNVTVKISANK
ncbi:MAG: ATP-binding protein [Clostridia bacterium]|nr:ATP-binding protein [Clostridia bacterium]